MQRGQEDYLRGDFAPSFIVTKAASRRPVWSLTAYAANGALLYGVYNGVDIPSESRYDKLSTEFTQPTFTLEQDIGESIQVTEVAAPIPLPQPDPPPRRLMR